MIAVRYTAWFAFCSPRPASRICRRSTGNCRHPAPTPRAGKPGNPRRKRQPGPNRYVDISRLARNARPRAREVEQFRHSRSNPGWRSPFPTGKNGPEPDQFRRIPHRKSARDYLNPGRAQPVHDLAGDLAEAGLPISPALAARPIKPPAGIAPPYVQTAQLSTPRYQVAEPTSLPSSIRCFLS
jgi:hypothetical protein